MTAQPYLRPDDCHCNASMGQDHARGCPHLYRPYKVLIDMWDGGRQPFTVNAMGLFNAKGLAFQTAIDKGFDPKAVVKVEELEPVETAYERVYGPDFDKLATYHKEGR